MMDLTGSPTECFDFEDERVDLEIKNGKFYKRIKEYDE